MDKRWQGALPSILVLVFLVLVLPLAVFLVGQREGAQNPTSKAFEPQKVSNQVSSSAPSAVETDDAYVDSDVPNQNFGGAAELWADGASVKITYLKFDLTSFSGKSIRSATLKLKVNHSSSGVQNVKEVADNSWSEKTLTFANKPSEGRTLALLHGGVVGSWVSADLTSFVGQHVGGVMSVAIDSAEPNGLGVNSKEALSDQPQLLVEWK